jgi:nicotinate-nucleotide adenylyltransferase
MSQVGVIKAMKRTNHMSKQRIGIFAGAFDPVHSGHIAFALQAMAASGLDEVVFLPERRPRHKSHAPEHYAHRVAMIKGAIQPHPQFSVLELADRHFTVSRTLPQLQALFTDCELVLLVGSDVVPLMPQWLHSTRLLRQTELVVGIRSAQTSDQVERQIGGWPGQPLDLVLLDSFAADISSASIRHALRLGRKPKGLLTSVKRYVRQEWLYVSPGLAVRSIAGESS